MANKFDPYREALVLETETVWPQGVLLDQTIRERIEQQLHADAGRAAELEYIRLHTGFCRRITITPEDLARLGVNPSQNPIS